MYLQTIFVLSNHAITFLTNLQQTLGTKCIHRYYLP